jgi:hypothetical protein
MAATKKKVKRPHGQLRRSQLVGGTGPGALLDLPRHAVIIGGLEFWGNPFLSGEFDSIDDERTRARLARDLKVKGLRLFSPPVEGDTFRDKLAPGVIAWRFPGWFVAQRELQPGVRPLVSHRQLDGNKWLDDERKKHSVVPVRFVRACKHGHIDDIDWKDFVHRGDDSCSRQLLWQERGSSFDFVDIFVACQCGKSRSIIEATMRTEGRPNVGWCNGRRPWLDDWAQGCRTDDDKPVEFKMLVRNASNAYFALTDHSISIPEPNQALRTAVGKVIDPLSAADDIGELKVFRKQASVAAALGTFTNEEVWAEIQRRKDPKSVDERAPKVAELQTFLAVKGQEGVDAPESVFFAREASLPSPRPKVLKPISKVLLVERLREVAVQVGFTRFEAPSTDVDGELDLEVRSGALAKELSWLPAVENRGEGIFIAFDKDMVKAWAKQPKVVARKKQLDAGYVAWAATHKVKKVAPSVEYVMLHSLSHLLVTALALECGYSASSIRERVYALEEGYGILLHTGTPDAEGTLGGLVNAAKDIERLLLAALELGAICSSDPVCAHHRPDDANEERFLHGAACHGCLLLSETSCELRNDHLDRALVVETIDGAGCHFFEAP